MGPNRTLRGISTTRRNGIYKDNHSGFFEPSIFFKKKNLGRNGWMGWTKKKSSKYYLDNPNNNPRHVQPHTRDI